MKRTLLAAIALATGVAMAQPNEEVDLLAAKGPVTFLDSKLFDRRLSNELDGRKDRVEVTVTSRVSLSEIPQRMDKWLVAVAEEGKVEFKEIETVPRRTRFILGLIPLVFSSLKAMDEERQYKPAHDYDVVVFYKKNESGDALIEKLVFTRKKPD